MHAFMASYGNRDYCQHCGGTRADHNYAPYRLPGGRVVLIHADQIESAGKGAREIGFTLSDGTVVTAVRVS